MLACLLGIVLLALVLRVYRLPDLMILAPDQGRDALVVRDMLTNGVPVLEGQISSAGTFHRGPVYYYLLGIAYAVSGGDPIGGSLLSVALDVGTIVLCYLVLARLAGPRVALITAALWAISPVLVGFAREQWNPQAMPFFVWLALFGVTKLLDKRGAWLVVIAPAWLIGWQMHELALFLLPPMVVGLLITVRVWFHVRYLAAAALASLLALGPYLVQQMTHGFRDSLGFLRYLLGTAGTGATAVPSPVDRLASTISGLGLALPTEPLITASLIALAVVGLAVISYGLVGRRTPEIVVLAALVATPLSFLLWRATFLPFYLIPIYPVPLILAAIGLNSLLELGTALPDRRQPIFWVATRGVAISAFAIAALGMASVLHDRAIPAIAWQSELEVARAIEGNAGDTPFALDVVISRRGEAAWRPSWIYALRSVGALVQPSRADLPTYTVFDPAGPGVDNQVGAIGWSRDEAPTTCGTNLAVGPWVTSESVSNLTTTEDRTSFTVVDPVNPAQILQELKLPAPGRYLVRFRYAADPWTDGLRAYLQALDSSGNVILTQPSPAGFSLGPTPADAEASFVAEVPPGALRGRLIFRSRGAGVVSLDQLEVLQISDGACSSVSG